MDYVDRYNAIDAELQQDYLTDHQADIDALVAATS